MAASSMQTRDEGGILLREFYKEGNKTPLRIHGSLLMSYGEHVAENWPQSQIPNLDCSAIS